MAEVPQEGQEVRLVGAADVPEPTIRPTGMSVSSSETQNGQLAPFEVSLLRHHRA